MILLNQPHLTKALVLHAWVHHFSSGETFHYTEENEGFIPLIPPKN